jgi:hypothetical protein
MVGKGEGFGRKVRKGPNKLVKIENCREGKTFVLSEKS